MTAPADTAAPAHAPGLPPALEIRDLVVRYGKGRKARQAPPAIDGVSFDIAPGETVVIAGAPRARRRRTTQPCTTFAADGGGAAHHNAAASSLPTRRIS